VGARLIHATPLAGDEPNGRNTQEVPAAHLEHDPACVWVAVGGGRAALRRVVENPGIGGA